MITARYKDILIRTPIIIVFLLLIQGCTGLKSVDENKSSDEIYRPLFHFTPDSMWMNDPNGLTYLDGEYHMFYQYHPYSNVWGPMHWGHAISKDLVHWQHLPIAIYPDSLGYIFSGSVVIDNDNTSGLGSKDNPAMVAIFTYHDMKGEKSGTNTYQNQGIAYSTDKGRTWIKYSKNPVLKNPGLRDFRDPKVRWFEPTKKWVLTLAVGDHVNFYSSTNLKDWYFESEFGKCIGAHGGVWECPDLLEFSVDGEKKWVLLVSINPGGPNGGSATQYFIGNFDGHQFLNESQKEYWVDYGKDNYAGVTFSNLPKSDGRIITIGWMSNWQYAQVVPTTKWRSAMTFPRELKLISKNNEFKLNSVPVDEIQFLREQKDEISQLEISDLEDLNTKLGNLTFPLELIVNFQISPESKTSAFGIELLNEDNESVEIGYNKTSSRCYIDRTKLNNTNFSIDYAGIHKSQYIDLGLNATFHILIDASSVELFVNDGEVVMTDIFFPEHNFDKIRFFSKKGSTLMTNCTIYKLTNFKE